MLTIKSHRSIFGFYLGLFFWCLFYFLMFLMIGGIFVHQYNSKEFETPNYGVLLLLGLILIGACYTIYKYFKKAPAIEVDNRSIAFEGSIYFWKDIEKIELTGKQPFLFLTNREGVLLKFKGQKERVFLDALYGNSYQIKQFIQSEIIDKVDYDPKKIIEANPLEIENDQFIKYKGLQFFNFRAIFLFGILIGLVYASILKIHSVGLLIFFVILGTLVFFGFSWFLYYFELSDQYFLVRNHDRFWVKEIYKLSDIREIVFEQEDRMPDCLRIITKDFKSELYPAASLRYKIWRKLKEDLEKKNIKVRNECIPDHEPFEFKFFND
jgi:hypothetical protein